MTTVSAPPALHEYFDRPVPHGSDSVPRATPYTLFSIATALDAYRELVRAMPVEVWYAVKAAPVPELLRELSLLGAKFDVASPGEIDLVLAAGARPEQLSYGNPVRSYEEVLQAAAKGIRTWVVDIDIEVQRIARVAPGSEIVIRLANDGGGAAWPLRGKFGCSVAEADQLARLAHARGLRVAGLSFHVGSQQLDVQGWDDPVEAAGKLWSTLAADGIQMRLLNLGGGLPCEGYRTPTRPLQEYADAITAAVEEHFPGVQPQLVAEPGRSLVAAAGVTVTTVKRVVQRPDGRRYVFLDGGIFSIGLVEAIDSVIEYRIEALGYPADTPLMPVAVVGPTCDSLDEVAARTPYLLPVGITEQDRVVLWSTGAYTWSYSSTHFNGYAPASLVVIP